MTPAGTCAQAAFAAALLDAGRPCPPGVRAWNGSDPAPRLAVHRNNVVSSLIDALAETFPVVQELVGVAFFRAMVGVFVRQAPPRSRVLAHYGQGLPEFIEQFEPARPVPYLADMARLEYARVRAYHAADADAVAAKTVSLALASGERIGELRLTCHPSLATLGSRYAVVSLWAAHQGSDELGAIDTDAPEAAIIVREGLEVVVLRAPAAALEFVQAIRQGRGLGDAAALATSTAAAFDLSSTLALLLRHGAITSIQLPRRDPS